MRRWIFRKSWVKQGEFIFNLFPEQEEKEFGETIRLKRSGGWSRRPSTLVCHGS